MKSRVQHMDDATLAAYVFAISTLSSNGLRNPSSIEWFGISLEDVLKFHTLILAALESVDVVLRVMLALRHVRYPQSASISAAAYMA
mgnify:CR=1 FL=1